MGLFLGLVSAASKHKLCLQHFNHCLKFKNISSSRNLSTSTSTLNDKKVKKFDEDDEIEMADKLKMLFAQEESYGDVVPIFKKALLYGNKIAIKDHVAEYSYHRLYAGAKKLSLQLSNLCGSASGARIAFLCPNDTIYPLVQWSCWFSGQIAVPLSTRHPSALLQYFIEDSDATVLLTTPDYENIMKPLAEKLDKILIVIDHTFIPEVDQQSSILDPKNENLVLLHDQIVVEAALNSKFYAKSNAMILYTSGTTGNPKGVVLTHKNLNEQVKCLTEAWKFTGRDCLLHALPLNHVHGCVNALMCPLSMGAKIVMHEQFDSHNVWSSLLAINTPTKDRVNMFMGVPTIYNLLIDEYDKIFSKNSRMVEYIFNHCEKNVRLMVSGSAPLPVTVFNRWEEISGHKLLERYGMTEVGMALSNPYYEDKSRKRVPGSVGLPLPAVEIRLVNSDTEVVHYSKGEYKKGFWSENSQPVYEKLDPPKDPIPKTGELQIKGPNVFKEYWRRPEETKKQFADGFFKTGDIATFSDGIFKILGRLGVDIIKTGGYKVSALEIETQLLIHPNIKDVAVVGLPDLTWGEKVAAVIVLKTASPMDLNSLQIFCSDKIAKYAMPTVLEILNELPRNSMGKVNKKEVVKLCFSQKIEQV